MLIDGDASRTRTAAAQGTTLQKVRESDEASARRSYRTLVFGRHRRPQLASERHTLTIAQIAVYSQQDAVARLCDLIRLLFFFSKKKKFKLNLQRAGKTTFQPNLHDLYTITLHTFRFKVSRICICVKRRFLCALKKFEERNRKCISTSGGRSTIYGGGNYIGSMCVL